MFHHFYAHTFHSHIPNPQKAIAQGEKMAKTAASDGKYIQYFQSTSGPAFYNSPHSSSAGNPPKSISARFCFLLHKLFLTLGWFLVLSVLPPVTIVCPYF